MFYSKRNQPGNLTASASKGKMGVKFYYYHCAKGCKERQRAEDANKEFVSYLSDFTSNPQSMRLFATILKERFKEHNTTGKGELEKNQKEIARQKQRLKNAKDLMLDGEISASEFKEMKYEIEEQLTKLEVEESNFRAGIENHSKTIEDSLEVLQSLNKWYISKNTTAKQRIVSSIFPEKLVFENKQYRTPKINEGVLLLCADSKVLEGYKKTKHPKNEMLSCEVERTSFSSNISKPHFIHEISKINHCK